ncbi:MAG TPA: UvrD-helicase domain-containing protein [Candidatus Binatia bacterium]|jgi:ATP-dependent helicase/nuclease subunit A
MTIDLPDSLERERAATTFDRNVVVTAGAGTGKTRLLIDRLVHLLMRDPETKLTQIVALTFTNKAATEMKVRLRERLQSYVAITLDAAATNDDTAREEVRNLLERYHLTKEALDRRALDALRQIERSEIGTIHSFAASLLRLYPMESGVDPQFIEDDGARFDRLFDEHWGVWLDEELSYRGTRQEDWKQVLRKVRLDEVRVLAASICSETVDLQRLGVLSGDKHIPVDIALWLGALEKRAFALLQRHPENRSNEKLIRASRDVLQKALRSDAGDCTPDLLSGGLNKNLKGWDEEDYREAQEVLRVAKALCHVDDSLSRSLAGLLIPFAETFRDAFTRAGLISFDGLLARARALVRDRLAVREQLKRRFQAILIDEFQDTDPIQYEILVYLAEEIGKPARNWKDVALTPGKVFVVGDPKQSIYAFRRADIQAYLEVVEKIIKAQNGIECRLTTNFRSHEKILDVVNGVFDRLIRPKEGLQPEYVAIGPAPAGDGARAPALAFRKVTIRIVRGNEADKQDTELARRLEAESLARWLDEEVLGKAEIADRDGKRRLVQPRDVAILFRKLTDVHHYLEPLRRRSLNYVVEGERHFYAVQEIIDAVNLLRAVDNPHDRLALVGVLRSPLGGLADAEIYELHRRLLLDYRVAERKGKKPDSFSKVKELYEVLCRLNRTIRTLPVGEAIGRVFESLPVRLLAAGSFHGEQAVANLEKLRYQAELMGREGLSTFKEVVTRLGARVLEIKEEAESALAEENLDAIRILSIHKSKGLEFPVVVLAGCHTVPQQAGARQPAVLQDWTTGRAGLCTESYWSLAGLYIAERARLREQEEHKRVLYVAMTRAREHLMISCAPGERKQSGSYLSMLEQGLQREIAEIAARQASQVVAAGAGTIEVEVVPEGLSPPGRARASAKEDALKIDWESYTRLWQRRAREYEAARAPLFLTPTLLKLREAELTEALPESKKLLVTSELSLVIGELAHRFLENWDFGGDPAEFRAGLDPFLDRWIESKRRRDREQLSAELQQILATFFSSAAYRDLSGAEILGREIPLLIPWDGGIMEGVIDLLYEKGGRLFLADYKTDRVERSELAQAASRYHHQVEIYSEAARRVLKKDIPGFKLIFLRLGEAVDAL